MIRAGSGVCPRGRTDVGKAWSADFPNITLGQREVKTLLGLEAVLDGRTKLYFTTN